MSDSSWFCRLWPALRRVHHTPTDSRHAALFPPWFFALLPRVPLFSVAYTGDAARSLFCLCVTSLCIMRSRFTSTATDHRTSLFMVLNGVPWYVCPTLSLPIHPVLGSLTQYVDCCWLYCSGSRAQMPLCTLISLPLYLYPKVSLLDLMIVLFLILWGFSILFSMMTIVICKCVEQLFFWTSLPMLVILVMKISAIQCLYLRINIAIYAIRWDLQITCKSLVKF